MIQRVAIKGFKSLVDVDVRLEPLSVLFGPNAAGKSNFLDALQLLGRFVSEVALSDAFEKPFRGERIEAFSYGKGGIGELLSRGKVTASFEIEFGLSTEVRKSVSSSISEMSGIESKIRSATDANGYSREIQFESICFAITFGLDLKSGKIAKELEHLNFIEGNRIIYNLLDSIQSWDRVNKKFVDVRGATRSHIYSKGLNGLLADDINFPHFLGFVEELLRWQFFHFEPREKMRSVEPLRELHRIGTNGEGLAAFLNTLNTTDRPKFETIQCGLRHIVPSVQRIETEVNNYGNIELRIVENGVPISARLMSEGTLRILGLLAVCVGRDKPTLIGLEEPENGIPPRRLKLIAEFLKTQTSYNEIQFIVTTHSPLLPDLVPESSLFVCRKRNGATSITPFSKSNGVTKGEQITGELEDDEPLTPSERILRGDFDA